jgi:hypothetical protein
MPYNPTDNLPDPRSNDSADILGLSAAVMYIQDIVTGQLRAVKNTDYPAGGQLATADALPPTTTPLQAPGLWNGLNLDRQRNNMHTTMDSTSITATGAGGTVQNYNHRGATFVFNVTAVAGTTPAVTAKIQVQDGASGAYYDIPGAVTASITAAGAYAIQVYPGIPETPNSRVSYALPRLFRAFYTVTGTGPSFTLSATANLIV